MTAAASHAVPFAIICEGVGFTYPGAESPALESINLRVAAGERLGILGPNGGGKSTLLKILLGLLPGSTGRVEVLGSTPAAARAAGLIGYLPQRATLELAMPVSVREMVELAATWRIAPWRSTPAPTRDRVTHILELVGAAPFAQRHIAKLSGGQLQRALVARALIGEPKILILDEPAVGIDAAGQQLLADLLQRVHRELGLTILIVSHDLRAIAAGSDRVACLARRIHYHDSPQGLTPTVLGELFSHDILGTHSVLGDIHVHAHPAGECTHDHGHAHKHGPGGSGGGGGGGGSGHAHP